jgi:hypothetical protein
VESILTRNPSNYRNAELLFKTFDGTGELRLQSGLIQSLVRDVTVLYRGVPRGHDP